MFVVGSVLGLTFWLGDRQRGDTGVVHLPSASGVSNELDGQLKETPNPTSPCADCVKSASNCWRTDRPCWRWTGCRSMSSSKTSSKDWDSQKFGRRESRSPTQVQPSRVAVSRRFNPTLVSNQFRFNRIRHPTQFNTTRPLAITIFLRPCRGLEQHPKQQRSLPARQPCLAGRTLPGRYCNRSSRRLDSCWFWIPLEY